MTKVLFVGPRITKDQGQCSKENIATTNELETGIIMILQSGDDITGEFKVFSQLNGELVFIAIMTDHKLQRKIVDAIRCAENIACRQTKNNAIQHLEKL